MDALRSLFKVESNQDCGKFRVSFRRTGLRRKPTNCGVTYLRFDMTRIEIVQHDT